MVYALFVNEASATSNYGKFMGKDNQLTIVWVDFCKDNLLDKIIAQDKNPIIMLDFFSQEEGLDIVFSSYQKLLDTFAKHLSVNEKPRYTIDPKYINRNVSTIWAYNRALCENYVIGEFGFETETYKGNLNDKAKLLFVKIHKTFLKIQDISDKQQKNDLEKFIVDHQYDKKMSESLNNIISQVIYLISAKNKIYGLSSKSSSGIIPSFTKIFTDPDEVKASDMCFNIFRQLYGRIDGSDIVAYIDTKYKENCAPILDLMCHGVDINKIEKITCSHEDLKKLKDNVNSEVKAMQAVGTVSSIAVATYVMYQQNYSALGMLGINFLVRACNGMYTARSAANNSELSALSLFYQELKGFNDRYKSIDGITNLSESLSFHWVSSITGNATPSKYELKK